MIAAFFGKYAIYAVAALMVMLGASLAYGKYVSLQRDAAEARAEGAIAALAEVKADKDRQVGALSRQIEAARQMMANSASIMRAVNAAPPSSACASSPRVGVYLDELRRRRSPDLPNSPSRRPDAMPARTPAPGRHQ